MKTNKQLEKECRHLRGILQKYKRENQSWKFIVGILVFWTGGVISIIGGSVWPVIIAILIIAQHERIAKIW